MKGIRNIIFINSNEVTYLTKLVVLGKWIWFSWHPLGMVVAFVTLAGNAALIKKVKGYDNTKIHGS